MVLTGAGISAESGIKGADGLWENYPVEDVATPEGYRRNPELVLTFYHRDTLSLKRRTDGCFDFPKFIHGLI